MHTKLLNAAQLQLVLLSSAQFACSVLFAAQFKSMCSIEQPLRPYIPYPTISTVPTVPTVSTVPIVHTVLIVATVDTVGTVGVIRIDCIWCSIEWLLTAMFVPAGVDSVAISAQQLPCAYGRIGDVMLHVSI